MSCHTHYTVDTVSELTTLLTVGNYLFTFKQPDRLLGGIKKGPRDIEEST